MAGTPLLKGPTRSRLWDAVAALAITPPIARPLGAAAWLQVAAAVVALPAMAVPAARSAAFRWIPRFS
jgi:hypothetical protein